MKWKQDLLQILFWHIAVLPISTGSKFSGRLVWGFSWAHAYGAYGPLGPQTRPGFPFENPPSCVHGRCPEWRSSSALEAPKHMTRMKCTLLEGSTQNSTWILRDRERQFHKRNNQPLYEAALKAIAFVDISKIKQVCIWDRCRSCWPCLLLFIIFIFFPIRALTRRYTWRSWCYVCLKIVGDSWSDFESWHVNPCCWTPGVRRRCYRCVEGAVAGILRILHFWCGSDIRLFSTAVGLPHWRFQVQFDLSDPILLRPDESQIRQKFGGQWVQVVQGFGSLHRGKTPT